MNVTLTTDEQRIEFIARLLFLLSNYRYFERMYDEEPGRELKEVLQEWRKRIDDYLQLLGVLEYVSLQDLIKILNKPVHHAD